MLSVRGCRGLKLGLGVELAGGLSSMAWSLGLP